jgi:hypothetical protein
VAVVDAKLVQAVRVQAFREHLGDDPRLRGDLAEDVAVWKEHAELNHGYAPAQGRALPRSRVFPFVPRSRRAPLFAHDVF